MKHTKPQAAEPPPAPAPAFAGLLTDIEFQRANAHVYPSLESWRWAKRRHRAALVAAGAIVEIAGRHYVRPEIAAEVVVQEPKGKL